MKNTTLDYKTALIYGQKEDRVIETVGTLSNGKAFEIGYYNGTNKPKAIINVSPATGCPVGCNFCDLTESGGPLPAQTIVQQVSDMARLASKIDGDAFTQKPLKINYAKTGEPVLNPAIVASMEMIADKFPKASFKYSTSLPDVPKIRERIEELAHFASVYLKGSVQLQISLISTSESYRQASVGTQSNITLLPLKRVGDLITAWHKINPRGRIPNCSLLVSAQTPCDPSLITDIIKPGSARFRIRPVITTEHSLLNGLNAASSIKIEKIMQQFKKFGYDINDMGTPTPTESQYALASNVTRNRILKGHYPPGIWYVGPDNSLTPA